jgi:hypothetical protein
VYDDAVLTTAGGKSLLYIKSRRQPSGSFIKALGSQHVDEERMSMFHEEPARPDTVHICVPDKTSDSYGMPRASETRNPNLIRLINEIRSHREHIGQVAAIHLREWKKIQCTTLGLFKAAVAEYRKDLTGRDRNVLTSEVSMMTKLRLNDGEVPSESHSIVRK